MDFSLENMCRTCMNEDGEMFSVFLKENHGISRISYADMLMACASIQVYKDDDLPQIICQNCLKHLSIAYSFKQQSERSEATLREITKNPDIEFIKEEYYEAEDNRNDEFVQKSEKIDEFQTEFLEDEYILDTDYSAENSLSVEQKEFLDDNISAENILDSKNSIYDTTESLENKIKPADSAFLDDNVLVKNVLSSEKDDEKNKINNTVPQKSVPITRFIRDFKCPYCNQTFRSQQAFKKHKKNHAKKLLKCEICAKEFRSTHGLRYHMKIHNGIKNYACTFGSCTRKFRLKQALDKHLSIHNNEKNHLCNLCGKTYCTYDALYYHLKAHRGERPYLCIHCGKTFKQSCHLKAHMWVHDGIKRHVCSNCGKCYTSGHQLKKHIKKHCSFLQANIEKPTAVQTLVLVQTN